MRIPIPEDRALSNHPNRTVDVAALCAIGMLGYGAADAQTAAKPTAGHAQPVTVTIAAVPHTLQEALATAYANNPTLQASRAQLRATDENVAGALSGWRPQLVFTGQAGIAGGKTKRIDKNLAGRVIKSDSSADRGETTANLGLTQPIYSGGKVKATTNRAENQVLSTRAQLMATEQQVFSDTISAYINVIQDASILQLDISNEQLLTRQLQATNDRFRVGELTRTDVAQSEAALASATATRQTAEGTLESARATYEQLVGVPPGNLIDPQPLRSPVKSLEEAKSVSARNNPNVVAALFADFGSQGCLRPRLFGTVAHAERPVIGVPASRTRCRA